VIHQDYLEAFQAVRDSVPGIKVIVVQRDVPEPERILPQAALSYESLSDHPNPDDPAIPIDPSAMCLIMYTSGTTGPAKGVVYRYNRTGLELIARGAKSVHKAGDVLYTCLPLFHMNALFLSTQWAIHSQNTLALGPRFSASRFWDEIRFHGATTFNALGAMIPILLKQPPREDDAENPVRLVFSAACPASSWQEFEQRFNLKIWELYGAVDGGTFSCINVGNAPKGSIGKPMLEHRIVDEDENECAPGVPGELIFHITKPSRQTVEYFKDPDSSGKKMKDGWLRTGDLFYRDEKGFLYFVDRKTDSMRRRGENVSAFEVETAVCRHPDVLECAALGVASDLGEDDIYIAVVPRPGEKIKPQELYSFLEDELAFYQLPRYIEILEALPKTPTQKIQKGILKQKSPGPKTWDRDKERYTPRH
jgi:crotonobetaine/carnitine-CoA ligase